MRTPVVTWYAFRHSWATIAQNHCGASTEMIANVKNYLNSKVGQVNRVGIIQIRENIKYVAAMQGYNYSHIADHMGITHASFKMMMRKKYIALKTMYEIAGVLPVPLERLTRKTMFWKVKDKRKFGVLTRIYDGRPQYKE